MRTRLTFAQKKDVCVKLSSKPKPSQGELAEEYGVKQNTISDNNMNELEYECLQHLINELNTNNPMNAVEFISFDNDIQTRGMTDEEIVSSVRSMSKDTESDGEEEIETVSIKNALESLDNVFNFLVHLPADFNCDTSTVSTVRSLRKQVLMHHINNKKQSMLDGFVIRM